MFTDVDRKTRHSPGASSSSFIERCKAILVILWPSTSFYGHGQTDFFAQPPCNPRLHSPCGEAGGAEAGSH